MQSLRNDVGAAAAFPLQAASVRRWCADGVDGLGMDGSLAQTMQDAKAAESAKTATLLETVRGCVRSEWEISRL